MQKQISEADVQARERAIWKGYDGFEPSSMATLESPKSADLDARGRLTAEQRAIRRKALSVLKKYGALLKQLAESEVPGEAETAFADGIVRVQFERQGYFAVDSDSTDDQLVFNRTVSLKDSWAKQSSKG